MPTSGDIILLDHDTHALWKLYGAPPSRVWWTICGKLVLPEGKETPFRKRATCQECDKAAETQQDPAES